MIKLADILLVLFEYRFKHVKYQHRLTICMNGTTPFPSCLHAFSTNYNYGRVDVKLELFALKFLIGSSATFSYRVSPPRFTRGTCRRPSNQGRVCFSSAFLHPPLNVAVDTPLSLPARRSCPVPQ